MKNIKEQFIKLCQQYQVIKFGDFTLKSGVKSNYFFNAGLFNDGASHAAVGEIYAAAIMEYNIDFDILFGPAYKGIPIGTATSIYLNNNFNKNTKVSFSRKEVKNHGEGGEIIGAEIKGKKVLIIDDVLSRGTALKESLDLIKKYEAEPVGLIIGLDRQEIIEDNLTAKQILERDIGLPIYSIIAKTDLV